MVENLDAYTAYSGPTLVTTVALTALNGVLLYTCTGATGSLNRRTDKLKLAKSDSDFISLGATELCKTRGLKLSACEPWEALWPLYTASVSLALAGYLALTSYAQYTAFNYGYLQQAQHVFFLVRHIGGGFVLPPALWMLVCNSANSPTRKMLSSDDLPKLQSRLWTLSLLACACGGCAAFVLQFSLVYCVLLGELLLGVSLAVFLVAATEWPLTVTQLTGHKPTLDTSVSVAFSFILSGAVIDALIDCTESTNSLFVAAMLLYALATAAVCYVWPKISAMAPVAGNFRRAKAGAGSANQSNSALLAALFALLATLYVNVATLFLLWPSLVEPFPEQLKETQPAYGMIYVNLLLCWTAGATFSKKLSTRHYPITVLLCNILLCLLINIVIIRAASREVAVLGLHSIVAVLAVLFRQLATASELVRPAGARIVLRQGALMLALLWTSVIVYDAIQPFERSAPMIDLDAVSDRDSIDGGMPVPMFNPQVERSIAQLQWNSLLSVLSSLVSYLYQRLNFKSF